MLSMIPFLPVHVADNCLQDQIMMRIAWAAVFLLIGYLTWHCIPGRPMQNDMKLLSTCVLFGCAILMILWILSAFGSVNGDRYCFIR